MANSVTDLDLIVGSTEIIAIFCIALSPNLIVFRALSHDASTAYIAMYSGKYAIASMLAVFVIITKNENERT
jgi:hypothetical protein